MLQSHLAGVIDLYDSLEQNTGFVMVFNQLPGMALVLNRDRQIVYGNDQLLATLGLAHIRETLSLRPGDLLQCVNAARATGCGDSAGCRYCKILQTVLNSQERNSAVSQEARVTVKPGDTNIALDLKVTATPLDIDSNPLTMVFFNDISDQKRREYLEEIFLHDTRNSLHVLSLLTEILEMKEVPGDVREDLQAIQRQVEMLVEDIDGQQMLRDAEGGTLETQMSSVPTQELVSDCLLSTEKLANAAKVKIDFASESVVPNAVMTDRRLARRVLVNALKNAIEATPENGQVRVTIAGEKECEFRITNPGQMDAAVREQVFQRSFSTKGAGRGLGTYSMRLLMETYLGGKVSFSSTADAGTTFLLVFPIVQPSAEPGGQG